MKRIIVINGPNLNMLGIRETTLYGTDSLDQINKQINDFARTNGLSVYFLQTNSESEIIDAVHSTQGKFEYGIINPGAYSHYSIAIHDALASVTTPFIEVHLTNILNREAYRQHSITASACKGTISGFGALGYQMALHYIIDISSIDDGVKI